MAVDLHLHTTASDGSLTPEQVVEHAARLNLKTIAISDHDTVNGIDEALTVGKKLGVEVIPAVELSSKYDSRDMHVLGYFIDHKSDGLYHSLKSLRKARVERAQKIVECMQKHGIDITFDEVVESAGKAAVGRPHIARILLAKSYVSTIGDAFRNYLKRGAPCFLEKFVYPIEEAISIIHKAGGTAVFAHPGLAGLDDHIPEFIEMGLDGIEAYHSEHTPETVERYVRLAAEYGLAVSGGSDCHGPVSTHGLRLGTTYVPDEVVTALKQRLEERNT